VIGDNRWPSCQMALEPVTALLAGGGSVLVSGDPLRVAGCVHGAIAPAICQ
jgi:hypothetical protein